jgi:hypothetical protein
MRRHRVFLAICVLALALGAGYFLHLGVTAGHIAPPSSTEIAASAKQSAPPAESASIAHKQATHRVVVSSAPLPPPGTPLKDIYDELAARARSGDRAASVRLFHDTLRCRYADSLRQRYSFALPARKRWAQSHKRNSSNEMESPPGPDEDEMTWLEHTEPMCAGADQESSRSSPGWMLLAAQQGDDEAIDCYLDQDFINVNDALQHLQWLTDFQRDAPELASRAVTNGDWKAVSMLAVAYAGIGSSKWLSQTITPDAQQAYRYAYLLQLGGSTVQKNLLKTIEQQLTAEQIATARAWSNDVFTTRFHGTPMYTGALSPICPNPMVLQN